MAATGTAAQLARTPEDRPAAMTNVLRIGIVGPLLGPNPGWVTSQGEVLAHHLRQDGLMVRTTSAKVGRLGRLADTAATVLSWRGQVDVVIVLVFSGPAFAMADVSTLLAGRLGVPVVLALHGGDLPAFTARHPLWVRRVLERADALVAPSRYLAETVVPTGSSAEVIPNVIHLPDYPFRERGHLEPRLLWMRTFHPLYHPELAVETLALLRSDHPGATLTMAGQEKGSGETVRQVIRDHDLEAAVRLVGFLDGPAKQQEFGRHDLYLNTNRVDNMPVSILEAAAFGVPIVSTAVGGVPYLLDDGNTALLVPPESPRDMAAAASRLLREPDLAALLSRNGRALAERSAWPAVREQWLSLFDALLAARPR